MNKFYQGHLQDYYEGLFLGHLPNHLCLYHQFLKICMNFKVERVGVSEPFPFIGQIADETSLSEIM